MLRRTLGVAAVVAAAMTTGGAQAALPSDPLASGWTYDSIKATSEPTARILVLPRNDARPTIAGRPRVGGTLTGDRGRWSGTKLTFSYLWLRCRTEACWSGKPVSRTLRYRVRRADRAWRLKLVVTAVNDLAEETARSKLTARVP